MKKAFGLGLLEVHTMYYMCTYIYIYVFMIDKAPATLARPFRTAAQAESLDPFAVEALQVRTVSEYMF